jgi:hypothetical protein
MRRRGGQNASPPAQREQSAVRQAHAQPRLGPSLVAEPSPLARDRSPWRIAGAQPSQLLRQMANDRWRSWFDSTPVACTKIYALNHHDRNPALLDASQPSSSSPLARIVASVEGQEQSVIDPDGRRVVFDAGSHLHLAQGRRSWLLDHVEAILTTVSRPDYRDDDPRPGRERFYRQNALVPGRWMRVVLDFNDDPGWVVTVLVQDDDPRPRTS